MDECSIFFFDFCLVSIKIHGLEFGCSLLVEKFTPYSVVSMQCLILEIYDKFMKSVLHSPQREAPLFCLPRKKGTRVKPEKDIRNMKIF